ncbi:heterokaryon incompatibility protein-domain-containing protein [Xylaria sp. FL1042]|nr:heterokaryon incompatibility protein-domain-containing protein [Xylaria sp. FL1042]
MLEARLRRPGFRLVDVDKRKLLSDFPSGSKLGHDIKFAALSYVWGKLDTSRTNALLSSNKHELTAPGGLEKLNLPKAIEDAIIVCQKLQQRFLWVDRLCNQQDDGGPEKQAQINAMGNIYSSAEFTIVHASGLSMKDAIAGVTTARQCFQFRTVVCGLELISRYPDITVPMRGARWNERGWAYQEAVLSRRKLFFTPLELWFECSDSYAGYQREEQLNGLTKYATKFNDFVRHLESYTARSLSHQSNILDAFKGILTALYEGDLSIYGLPEANFDQALLWYCRAKWRPTVGASSFPSWSWPSVTGTVTALTDFLNQEEFLGTLAQWYYQDQNGELKNVKSEKSLRRWRCQEFSAQAYLPVAWWKECLEPAIPEDVMQELKKCPATCNDKYCPTCELQIKKRWFYLEDVWKDIEGDQKFRFRDIQHLMTGAREEERQLIKQLHPGVLLTRAQTTILKASVTKVLNCSTELQLANSAGWRIGGILPGVLEMGLEKFPDGTKPGEALQAVPFEYMGVSLSCYHGASRKLAVNMLVIQRKEGSPFWWRIAVGWVCLEDWFRADRTFKTTGLE